MQLRLPIPDTYQATTPIDPASIVGVGDASAETEVGRLQAELARIASQQSKWQRRRAKCAERLRKLRDRQASLAMQLDSLERNPLAIGRYRSTLPEGIVSTLWWQRSTSDLRLETLSGIGTRRLTLLYELCPTVGDLEVFRVHEGLTEIPGLRRITAARIEKRLFAWLRRHAYDYEPMPSRECVARVDEMPRVIL